VTPSNRANRLSRSTLQGTDIVPSQRPRPCRPRLLVLVLSSALIALLPVAHATPPDPLWIPGIYDAADYDDVVLTVAWAAWTIEPGVSFDPAVLPAAAIWLADPGRVPASRPCSSPIRAPPA